MSNNVRKSYLPHFLAFQALVFAFVAGFFTCYMLVKKDDETQSVTSVVDKDPVKTKSTDKISFTESEVIRITINYDLPLHAMVLAGNYDQLNPGITEENFPNSKNEKGKNDVSMKIFDFEKGIESKDAIIAMEQKNCRPATIKELIAYNQHGPRSQEGAMIALGSVTKDGYVAISWIGSITMRDRRLNLDRSSRPSGPWSSYYRFLAVKK